MTLDVALESVVVQVNGFQRRAAANSALLMPLLTRSPTASSPTPATLAPASARMYRVIAWPCELSDAQSSAHTHAARLSRLSSAWRKWV